MGLFSKLKNISKSNNVLPYGWITQNKVFTDKIHAEYNHFLNEWLLARKSSPLKEYGALKSLVLYLNDAKKLCDSKGKYFSIWFDNIIANSEYIAARESELMALEKNFHQLQDVYEKRQLEIMNIDDKIVGTLKANEGILQSDFVKLFDESIQNDVKEKLYFMDKAGKINRIKSGRSYILKLK